MSRAGYQDGGEVQVARCLGWGGRERGGCVNGEDVNGEDVNGEDEQETVTSSAETRTLLCQISRGDGQGSRYQSMRLTVIQEGLQLISRRVC
jgi:hypothetical protein